MAIAQAQGVRLIQNVHKNGSFVDKILPSNVNKNGSFVHMLGCWPMAVTDAVRGCWPAAERFQAIENVSKNGSFGHKILPTNEAQVRPLTQLSDAEAVHVWGQVTEQHERLYKSMT